MYGLVWGHKEFFGMDETMIKKSKDRDFLEDAQTLLSDMYDDDLIKYLEISETVLDDGIYFRIKSI